MGPEGLDVLMVEAWTGFSPLDLQGLQGGGGEAGVAEAQRGQGLGLHQPGQRILALSLALGRDI